MERFPALSFAVLLVACGGTEPNGPGGGESVAHLQPPLGTCGAPASTFYTAPASLDVPDGWLLRCETVDPAGSTRYPGRRGYRVLYKSSARLHETTGPREQPVALSGLVFVPEAPQAGPRPVLANTHGATGLLSRCAPSATFSFDANVMFSTLAAPVPGAVVVVPDFMGLGADPGLRAPDATLRMTDPLAPWTQLQPLRNVTHSYVSIEGEGRATIDLVRAARALPGADIGDTPRWMALGVSQGGHAALAAGETWTRGYGPDTRLLGVVAGAPGSDLTSSAWVLPEVERVLTPMVLSGLSLEHRGLRASAFLSSQALAAFGKTAGSRCLSFDAIDDWVLTYYAYLAPSHPLLRADPMADPVAAAALRDNSPGRAPTAAPVFIGQVTGDPFVDPRRTAALVALEQQTNPGRVSSCVYPGEHLSDPWTERGGNHSAFRWMFGDGPATCTGPDASAPAFIERGFAQP